MRQGQAKNPNHKDTEKIYSTKHHDKKPVTVIVNAMLASTVQFSNNNQTPPRTPRAPDTGRTPTDVTRTRRPDQETNPTPRTPAPAGPKTHQEKE